MPKAQAGKKRPYMASHQRRRALLGVAAEMVGRGGWSALTMKGLAAEAGVSRQLVYTPEQAELVQHLPMPMNAKTAEEVAEVSARDVESVEKIQFGLVATAENFLSEPHGIMCLCCGCCCSNLRGRTRWDNPTAIAPAHFIPEASDDCVLCGTCVERCLLDALSLDDETGRSVVDSDKCIGCGICTITCLTEAMKLRRYERPTRPFDTRLEFGITVARDNYRLPRQS